MEFPMATILPANFAFKDADGDVGTVKSLTNADITLLNTALQDIEDLKLCIDDPAPVGFIGLWGEDTLPSGWLLCNGAAVSRVTYAKLFTRIGTKYGAGDGSTTFNLPDFRDRYPIGTGVNATGTKIAEQLPNIKGMFQIRQTAVSGGTGYSETIVSTSGLCSSTTVVPAAGTHPLSGITANRDQVNFNANSSNSTYINSGKVYPLSLALNFIIKA